MKLQLLPLCCLPVLACRSVQPPEPAPESVHAPTAHAAPSPAAPAPAPAPAHATAAGPIQAERLLAHIRELASDLYEGRGPGTAGEERTVAYLEQQFRSLGLEPGNPDGSFVQEVPMVGIRSTPTARFTIGTQVLDLAAPGECVLLSRWFEPEIDVPSTEVLFAGYGIEAPEYAWNDFKDVDVRGKVLIVLVNDPPVADPREPGQLDENVFGGKAMTYYGRWTYKYEEARRKGALAVLIVHQDVPAGYPFAVVQNSWSRENFDLENPQQQSLRAPIEGWLRGDKAKELLAAGGLEFDELVKAAATREFRPVVLKDVHAQFHVHNELRHVRSRNVVARLPGRDAARRGECIVYSAHWDHLGVDPTIPGDGIFNGAVDNASGVAGLLEIARAFRSSGQAPPRTILFLALTGEEKGLLGSRWYAEHPLVPLERTLCDINMDSLNLFGRTRDLVSIGQGQSTLDAPLEELAHRQGRVVRGDSEPEKGYYYRSDHFEFAKAGVPAIYADSGEELIGRKPGEGQRLREEYTRERYHKPSDEVREDWDPSGAVEDLELLWQLGREVASAREWPEWKPGSEFRARRLEQLRTHAEPK